MDTRGMSKRKMKSLQSPAAWTMRTDMSFDTSSFIRQKTDDCQFYVSWTKMVVLTLKNHRHKFVVFILLDFLHPCSI